MPFDFLKRRKDEASDPGEAAAPEARLEDGIAFEGFTEEWHLRGRMLVTGRLSDVLNRREAIPIASVLWAPIDGTSAFEPAPGLRTVDPYDLIVVFADESTQPPMTEAERTAHRVHKVSYDVALEAPPFRVIGTVMLHPGSEPDRLLDRATEMFVPVVDASASLGDRLLTAASVDAILVNRSYLRGVEQIDRRTGERPQRLPGAPLGGVSWNDRSR